MKIGTFFIFLALVSVRGAFADDSKAEAAVEEKVEAEAALTDEEVEMVNEMDMLEEMDMAENLEMIQYLPLMAQED